MHLDFAGYKGACQALGHMGLGVGCRELGRQLKVRMGMGRVRSVCSQSPALQGH